MSGIAVTDTQIVREWMLGESFVSEAIIDIADKPVVLDLSEGSQALGEPLEALSLQRFSKLIDAAMQAAKTRLAFGRWGEPRALYKSDLFENEQGERRTIHLGVDLFCPAGTAVQAPLDAVIEIVANNTDELDYGPLVILRHTSPHGKVFFTLYGHLGSECLKTLRAGMPLVAGESFATVGSPPTNGNWPPHLHFQLVLDLLDLGRNFPGVAAPSQRDRWLGLSPNPAVFFPQVTAAQLDGRK